MGSGCTVAGDEGQFTLDAALVADGFGLSVPELQRFMRRGLVTSTVERGEGEHEGTWRLSLRFGNRRWLAIVGKNGAIAEQHLEFTRSLPQK